jgi:hypothetical protein
MQCPNCNTQLDDHAVFCGNCGNQVAPLYARGATVASNATEVPQGGDAEATRYTAPPTVISQQSYAKDERGAPVSQYGGPALPITPAQPLKRGRRISNRAIVFIGLLLILLVGGVSAGAAVLYNNGSKTANQDTNKNNATKAPSTGTTNPANSGTSAVVSLNDSKDGVGQTSALTLRTVGLSAPPAGSQYQAWWIDTANERILPLGVLTQNGQDFEVSFSGKTNLLGEGNEVRITQEEGQASAPTGKLIMQAALPEKALVHIKHLHFAFPTTPNNVGLLVGLREQARLLNAQALVLKGVSANPQTVSCIAQGMINIIEGKNGEHFQELSSTCASVVTIKGDGFGLLGKSAYIKLAADHAALAAQQPDATEDIVKKHAGHVRIATENLTRWTTELNTDALSLLANPGDNAKVQKIVTLADRILNGTDINNNETVDPIPDEAGAITAYNHGQLMATLNLKPGA